MAKTNLYDKAKGKVKVSQLNAVITVGLIALAACFLILVHTTKGLPVTFETAGGSKIAVQHYAYGALLEEPAEPHYEGKRFAGWYKDQDFRQAWDFASDSLSEATTLYAKWE